MEIIYRIHAVERMFERGISSQEVRTALEKGEVLENYADEAAHPAKLVLSGKGRRALHVVAADNTAASRSIVVTAYRPERERWTDDLRRRRDEVPDV